MLTTSIRARLITSLLFLAVITLVTFGSYVLWHFYQYTIESLTTHLVQQALIVEELVETQLDNRNDPIALDQHIKRISSQMELRITIIDRNGTVLADSWENPQTMDNHKDRPEIQSALSGTTGQSLRYSSTLSTNMLYVATTIQEGKSLAGVVRVSTTLKPIEEEFNRLRNVLLAAFVLTAGLALLISFRVARKFTAPLETITAAARQMGEGHLEERVHIKTGDELEILAHTLNKLAANLDDTVREILTEKSKLELILRHMDNGVILLDRYGQVTTVNKQAAEYFGLAPSQLGLHNLQAIGYSSLDQAVRETLGTKQNRTITLKAVRHGKSRVFQVFLAPVQSAASDGNMDVLAVFHDITALQELRERQTDFVANASHELGTPLTSIKGFAETLLCGALEDKASSEKFIHIIYTEADRMHRLVKDLLQLARLEAIDNRQQTNFTAVDMSQVIEPILRRLTPQLEEKEHKLIVEKPDKLLLAMADTDWISQIAINLLDNAIKYTPVKGSITVRWWQEGDRALLSVSDTGVGIAPQDLPRVFERFYRVDRARSRTAGGTGLGLSIVKHLVNNMAGTIAVESELNKGTTFTVSLPVVPTP